MKNDESVKENKEKPPEESPALPERCPTCQWKPYGGSWCITARATGKCYLI